MHLIYLTFLSICIDILPTNTSTRSFNLYWYPFPTAKKTWLSPPPQAYHPFPLPTYTLGRQKNGAQGWNECYLCNLTRSTLNNHIRHIPSTFCPIFAQVAPVCKVAPSGLQRCTQVKGATKKANEKKRTFGTNTNHQNNVEGMLHMYYFVVTLLTPLVVYELRE
jgi:hypothetical protein